MAADTTAAAGLIAALASSQAAAAEQASGGGGALVVPPDRPGWTAAWSDKHNVSLAAASPGRAYRSTIPPFLLLRGAWRSRVADKQHLCTLRKKVI